MKEKISENLKAKTPRPQRRAPLRTVSAGGVIVKLFQNQPQVLLARVKNSDRWIVPKGHVEAGETLRDAALREVQEEVGAQYVRLLEPLGTYRRMARRKIEHKTIHYFLMTPTAHEDFSQSLDPHFDLVRWHSFDRLPQLSLPEHVNVVERAKERIEKHRVRLWKDGIS